MKYEVIMKGDARMGEKGRGKGGGRRRRVHVRRTTKGKREDEKGNIDRKGEWGRKERRDQ